MSHYDLNRLGWQQFEHLVQALALKELGSGVRLFGSGSDGGREATFDGAIDFPKGGGAPWEGYGVLQVKHRERPTTTTADWKWFLDEVEIELKKWEKRSAASSGKPGAKFPQYFIFATNVTLTGTESTGGIDGFDHLLNNFKTRLNLKGWFAWDYTQLRGLIEVHPDVRQTYLEQISTGDLIASLEASLPKVVALTGKQLAIHAASELQNRQWVRIGDSGYGSGSKLRLSDIGIDLPCVLEHDEEDKHRRVARHLISVGDAVFRPDSGLGATGVVLVGGPGQGKSTIAQIVAHAYRIAFIEDINAELLGPTSAQNIDAMRKRLEAQSIPIPIRRRWPIFVDLAKFGSSLARTGDAPSILRYIANSILIAGKEADTVDLLNWMTAWPVCLILDGLDEVPNAVVRSDLVKALSSFVTELSSRNVDLFLIATTRPQGYKGEFEEALPTSTATLSYFTQTEALSYADALIGLRSEDDPELAVRVTERLFNAVHQRLTGRLMTTPLQVTIMTALAERAVALPTTRYELFDDYYSTIYDREIAKAPEFAMLRTLRSHVNAVQEGAGLALHIAAERPESPDALLRHKDVSKILMRRLRNAGYADDEAKGMSKELLSLTSDRLVLLVSPHGTVYRFEVRSIQEYMAARALTEGEDEIVLERLRCLIPSIHWRNVWLLAAGKLLQTKEHLAPKITSMLASFDATSQESSVIMAAAGLAGDLYLDGWASDFPVLREAMLDLAFTQLLDLNDEVEAQILRIMSDALTPGRTGEEGILLKALARHSRKSSSNVATKILQQYKASPDPIGNLARTALSHGRKYVKPEARDSVSRAFIVVSKSDWKRTSKYDSVLQMLAAPGKATAQAEGQHLPRSERAVSVMPVPVLESLNDRRFRDELVEGVRYFSNREPDVAHFITSLLRYWASREIVGHSLVTPE